LGKLSAYQKHVKKFSKDNPGLGKKLMSKAAAAWNKKTGKPKTKKKTNKSKSITKSSVKRMGKRKFTLPMAVIAPIAWKIQWSIRKLMSGDFEGATKDALWHFAAIDSQGKFNPEALKTWIPVIAGLLIHKFVGGAPLNLNRHLANAGLPLIRI